MSGSSIQILNTAIIKDIEHSLHKSYDERLKALSEDPAVLALEKAVDHLATSQNITRDQAALKIISTVRELSNIWGDYVSMEGIDKLKQILKSNY